MNYYVPYYEEYNINYIYLLLFYRMAVVDNNLWIKNTVNYRSLKDLAKRMNELSNCIRKERNDTKEAQLNAIRKVADSIKLKDSGVDIDEEIEILKENDIKIKCNNKID